jgi:hypothetical protein
MLDDDDDDDDDVGGCSICWRTIHVASSTGVAVREVSSETVVDCDAEMTISVVSAFSVAPATWPLIDSFASCLCRFFIFFVGGSFHSKDGSFMVDREADERVAVGSYRVRFAGFVVVVVPLSELSTWKVALSKVVVEWRSAAATVR